MSETMTSWPSGSRDTTAFPAVSIEIDVSMREHLEAFCKLDGVDWDAYDQQGEIGELSVTSQRLRTYRKMYERLGMLYRDEDNKIRLSRLGRGLRDLKGTLEAYKDDLLHNLTVSAVDILARYQLKNPIDGPNLPNTCDVQPYLCIWKAMRALGNKINIEEMNRVILHVVVMDQLDEAIEKIKAARAIYGDYHGVSSTELDTALGIQVHPDQPSARIAPWFSNAGWGGLIIQTQQVDGYRWLTETSIPIIDEKLKEPPSFYNTDDEDAWMKYYIGDDATHLETSSSSVTNGTEPYNTVLSEETISIPPEVISEPHNLIFFGAPGTGKSFQLKQLSKKHFDEQNMRRVTFHPDYTYAQFVGCYKPIIDEDKLEERNKRDNDDASKDIVNQSSGEVTYAFVPGPFLETYLSAVQNPSTNYLLIIEEINRANPAAAFGDIFQLLDRNEEGRSEYEIAVPVEMRSYFSTHIPEYFSNTRIADPMLRMAEEMRLRNETKRLSLPPNMYIWATMNSADQGVFPMDTAFKRRWDFRYMDINAGEDVIEDSLITIGKPSYRVRWNDLRKAINTALRLQNVNEDKLLGPFFIPPSRITDDPRFIEVFKAKVLLYLYEDAVKLKHRSFFALGDHPSYADVCRAFETNGESIIQRIPTIEHYSVDEEGEIGSIIGSMISDE